MTREELGRRIAEAKAKALSRVLGQIRAIPIIREVAEIKRGVLNNPHYSDWLGNPINADPFERDMISYRAVSVTPLEAWQVQPIIYTPPEDTRASHEGWVE